MKLMQTPALESDTCVPLQGQLATALRSSVALFACVAGSRAVYAAATEKLREGFHYDKKKFGRMQQLLLAKNAEHSEKNNRLAEVRALVCGRAHGS